MSGPVFPRQVLNRILPEPAERAGSAERPGGGLARRIPLTPQQRALLRETAARPGSGGRVAQFVWPWRGPLDTGRFTAAWRSVIARESVLRTAVAWPPGAEPQAVVHPHAGPARSGPLRLTLADAAGSTHAPASATTRVLLTFDHALLDGHSVVLLLHQLCRAYLAGGRLPGGERRPDFEDYARWLGGRSTTAAREFWAGALSVAPHTALPVVAPPVSGGARPGVVPAARRAETRLSAGEAGRLYAWGAEHAASESLLLQAAWALVLYGTGRRAPAVVGFGTAVSGRSIPLAGVERLPGRLTNVLPVTVRVDPAGSVAALLNELRDWALGTAAYEWVASEQIRDWTGRAGARLPLFESQVAYSAPYPRMPPGLRTALAAQGIRPGTPQPGPSPASVPALSGRPEPDGGLVLTLRHDRTRMTGADASRLVERCARVLRALCRTPGGTTVGAVMDAAG